MYGMKWKRNFDLMFGRLEIIKDKIICGEKQLFYCGYNYYLCLFQNFLGILGIFFFDVMRIFFVILLLGNIEFIEGIGLELDIIGNNGK